VGSLWLAAFALAAGAAVGLLGSLACDRTARARWLGGGGLLFVGAIALWLLFEYGNATGGIRIDLFLLFPILMADAALLIVCAGMQVGQRLQQTGDGADRA